MPRPARVVGGKKAFGVDDRLVVALGREVGEGNAPRFAHAASLRAVGEDSEDPAAERGAAFEAAKSLEHSEPGFLHHFLRYRAASDEERRYPEHGRMHLAHEGDERLLVAGAESR